MSATRGIYAGSFDLLTVGHMWMIEEGAKLFSELIVAVGDNPDKRTVFDHIQRVEMLQESTEFLNNVRIGLFKNMYLYRYAQQESATHILRGIRNATDYEAERTMRNLNGDFEPAIATVFLMPPREISEVSSSVVKGLIGPQGWEATVKPFVPSNVMRRLVSDASS